MKGKLVLYMMMAFMRIASMGGKFILTLVAVKALAPAEFGRYGLIAAGVWIGVMVAGLEVASVMLRDVVTSAPWEARRLRGFFLTYVAAAGLVSATLAALAALLAGFGGRTALLVALIMGLEYVGQELTRLLITANYQARGALMMFCRSGLWCYALVLTTFALRLPFRWSLTVVLLAWIISDLIALAPALVLREIVDWDAHMILEVVPMLRGLLRRAAPFVISTVGFQVLLSGGRFFVAFFDSEAASGRFTLLSTVASLNLILVKGICEQIFFAKVVGNDRDKHWGEFSWSVYITTAAASIAALLAIPVYNHFMGKMFTPVEMGALGVLLFGHVALCVSVISKFQLYSAGRDRDLMVSTSHALLVFFIASLALTGRFGLTGAATGMTLGALVLSLGQVMRTTPLLREARVRRSSSTMLPMNCSTGVGSLAEQAEPAAELSTSRSN